MVDSNQCKHLEPTITVVAAISCGYAFFSSVDGIVYITALASVRMDKSKSRPESNGESMAKGEICI